MPIDYDCVNAILEKNGVNKEDIKDFRSILKENISEDLLVSDKLEEFRAAKKNALKEMTAQKLKQYVRVLRNDVVVDNLVKKINTISSRFDTGVVDALGGIIEGKRLKGWGGINASSFAESIPKYESALFLNQVKNAGFHPKLLSRVTDSTLNRNIILELTTGILGDTGDQNAVALARITRSSLDRSRLNLERTGIDVGYLESYYPRTHNRVKMANVGQAEWVRDMFAWSNIKDIGFLEDLYADFIFGRIDGSNASSGTISGPRAKRRVIKFDNPDLEYQYAQKYGEKSVLQSTLKYIQDVNYRAGISQILGPDPEKNLHNVMRELFKEARKGEKFEVLEKIAKVFDIEKNKFKDVQTLEINFAASIQKLLKWDYADNVSNIVSIANANLKSFANVTSLAASTLKALTGDFYTRAANLTFQGENFWKSLSTQVIDTFKPISKEVLRDILPHLGIEADGLTHECTKFIEHGENRNTWNWLSTLEKSMFKLNFMEYVTNKARNLQALKMSNNYANLLERNSWKDIQGMARRHFEAYDIGVVEWAKMRDAIQGVKKKSSLLGEVETKYLNPDLLGEKDKKLQLNLITMFNREADFSVLHPNASTQRWKTLNTSVKRGTLGYALYDLMFQFKSFSFGFFKDFVLPTFDVAIKDRNPLFFGNMMAGAFVVGYAGVVVDDLTHGRTPKSLTKFKTYLAVAQETQIFGIFTDAAMRALGGTQM